jgi:hypothetical protein
MFKLLNFGLVILICADVHSVGLEGKHLMMDPEADYFRAEDLAPDGSRRSLRSRGYVQTSNSGLKFEENRNTLKQWLEYLWVFSVVTKRLSVHTVVI